VAPSLSVLTRNRDFRYLFLAQLVVFGGDWFALIPLITLLQQLTSSGLPGALALAADTAVGALVLPFAGTLADRFDRRWLMIIANLGTIAAIAVLFAVRTPGTAWLGPVAIGLAATAKSLYTPAAGAALPNVVDAADLPAANALGGSAWGTMLVLGASLGGVVNQVFNAYVCFAIDLACLAVAAALVWLVRRPLQTARDPDTTLARPLHAIAEAMRYIRREPRVLSLVTVKSAVGLGNGVLAVFPILATVVFAVGPIGTGLLFAARGFGALIGPLLLRRVLTHRSWLLPGLAISMAVYGLMYLGVAVSPWFGLTLILVVVAHMSGGGNWMISNYALQIEVPDHLRGRVFATDMMLATLAISVSVLLAGVLVDHVNPRIPIAICGGLTLLYGIVWRLATRPPSPSPESVPAPA
jgi:MFS family permease